MWFDVGIVRYTTSKRKESGDQGLWFDVGIVRYTTTIPIIRTTKWLWFDVGIVRYTTMERAPGSNLRCGLM